MSEARGGRPRDARLHSRILTVTRELLMAGSYAELTMERVAARAGIGKKTLYRRWPSKAPLVADAVLDAYGQGCAFHVPDTGHLRADLCAWLDEHAEFVAAAPHAALIRAVIAAAAGDADGTTLYHRLSVPQYDGLLVRLRRAADTGEVRADADLDAIANALIGTLLLRTLSPSDAPTRPQRRFDGLLDALLARAAPGR